MKKRKLIIIAACAVSLSLFCMEPDFPSGKRKISLTEQLFSLSAFEQWHARDAAKKFRTYLENRQDSTTERKAFIISNNKNDESYRIQGLKTIALGLILLQQEDEEQKTLGIKRQQQPSSSAMVTTYLCQSHLAAEKPAPLYTEKKQTLSIDTHNSEPFELLNLSSHANTSSDANTSLNTPTLSPQKTVSEPISGTVTPLSLRTRKKEYDYTDSPIMQRLLEDTTSQQTDEHEEKKRPVQCTIGRRLPAVTDNAITNNLESLSDHVPSQDTSVYTTDLETLPATSPKDTPGE